MGAPKIDAHVAWLQAQLASVDSDLQQSIQQSPIWREKDDLLQSMPGVGPVVSQTLLAGSRNWDNWIVARSQPSSV